MGESVSEGSIVEWRVKPGGWIDEGATLVDVTTDKVDVEVPAPASGVVTAVFAGEGDVVSVGKALAEIDTSAARPSNGAAAAPAAGAPSAPAAAPKTPAPAVNGSGGISHRAARRVERAHLDPGSVKGTGPGGMILAGDVAAAQAGGPAKGLAAGPPAPALPPLPAEARVTPLKGPAAALAGYMEQSLSIPTATSFRTVGVGVLDARRAELNAALKAAGRAEKASFTHLIAYALVRAASELPFITASYRREDGKPARVEAGVHLGLAVDSERKDGTRFLVVPVIKNADAGDFKTFRAAYENLVAKSRDNALTADDLTGASFTLTNPGGIGTVASVPRLMAGQGAIIAAGAIAYPPGFASAPGAALKQLGVEKVMTLTSTYDHRVIQGAQSGEYLRRVDQLLGGADGFYEAIFASLGVAAAAAPPSAAPSAVAPAPQPPDESSGDLVRAVAAAASLVGAYRRHGHLAAHLDPLGTPPQGDPSLDPASYHLTPAMMQAIPASVLRVKVPGSTLADVLPRLRETYTSTIAYELEHISNTGQREWLRDYIERGLHREALPHDRKLQVLNRLTKTETMERYFRKNFMSQKTFSIEGLDMMVPMLEEMLVQFTDDGIGAVVLGMAHRGRLSTIAHVVNRPYEELLAEFEVYSDRFAIADTPREDATGDVKYHHGAEGIYETPSGRTIRVVLANNPSHLEAVDGVVEGMVRCLQTDHTKNIPAIDPKRAAPILIHGDAAFSGQGVVAEVLNLQALPGYATGGTVHLIADNQIGFTTDPSDGRSTRYASDLAKGFDAPIVHVNADDVDACIAAVRLAIDFRRAFERDVIIDLIGYRRFGHNEQDEPAYTQPAMYEAIKKHPTVRELFAAKLTAEGVATAEQVNALLAAATARITDAHKNVKEDHEPTKLIDAARALAGHDEEPPVTGVGREQLLAWSDELVRAPEGFTVNKKLTSQFERRAVSLRDEGEVDWGTAEGLAFASLISEGTPVRLTGQDTERGTFSHRHAVLRDAVSGGRYVPLQHIAGARASFEIYNSPLSEFACLGFEYGYSTALTSALVLWEAQFGDFNNGAQVIIDQFIAAGAAKWGQLSRLTLLLPHGYEGAGPEHSSARLERFLLLSAEGNIRIANCSNAAQYFHLLRAQAHSIQAFPLVVLTPKSLLRKRSSFGNLSDMTQGSFREVIDDPRMAGRRDEVRRIVLCSGKIYHDLTANDDQAIAQSYAALRRTAIVRVELLSPFPTAKVLEVIDSYPNAREIVWVQEEPKNMGARAHVRRRLVEELPGRFTDLEYIGRPYRASPSEGYPGAHAVEQERIVRETLREAAD
jgi:2-oxoglutarate dehydrogenase E1 component